MMMKIRDGFTLIEALVSISILGILLAMAIPAWDNFIQQKRLISATEALQDTFRLAHSESVTHQATITVSFVVGANWCVGLSDVGNCNCNTAGSCLIKGVQRVFGSTTYLGVSFTAAGFAGTNVQYDGARGVASDSGNITLTNGNYSTSLTNNRTGLVSICSDTVAGYSGC